MLIKRPRGWEIPGSEATPESVFLRAASSSAGGRGGRRRRGARAVPGRGAARRSDLRPLPREAQRRLQARPRDHGGAISADYNNFYEFGSSKSVASAARALKTRPWTVRSTASSRSRSRSASTSSSGRCRSRSGSTGMRCVEAWAMAVPWTGFPMKAFLDLAKPLGSARYLRMETFHDKSVAPGQRQIWYPWPYVEGLTIAGGRKRARLPGHRRLRQAAREPVRRALAARGAVEIRLQIREIARQVHLRRGAAEELLGGAARPPSTASGRTSTRRSPIRAGARRPSASSAPTRRARPCSSTATARR